MTASKGCKFCCKLKFDLQILLQRPKKKPFSKPACFKKVGLFQIRACKIWQAKAWEPSRAPAISHDFFSIGTGTPAIRTLNEPRLVRVQKYTVFQSSPPNATF